MKKTIHFSKFFLPAVIISVILISSGVFSFITRGFNLGIDFKPGLVEEVKIAPSAIALTYKGTASVAVNAGAQDVSLVVSGAGADNITYVFTAAEYPTAGTLAEALRTVEGVSVSLLASAETPSSGFFVNSEFSNRLSTVPYRLHYIPSGVPSVSTDEVRSALEAVPDAAVKMLGLPSERTFQIRVGDDGSDPAISETIKNSITGALVSSFGAENIAVVKTDFIGAQFSKTLVTQTIVLVLLTMGLIWIYAAIRFKWDFALGAVLALLHDVLIMVAFITWTQMEFTSLTIAAILTIIGYSINDTVVVFDRIRENIKLMKGQKFREIMDVSLSETLSRTVITTLTTLLAVVSLYIFTSGSMKDFALALIVGMISGVYSTIFIASAFIALTRKNWKADDEEKKTRVITALSPV